MTVYRLRPVRIALLRTIDAGGFIVGRSVVKSLTEHDGTGFLPGLGGRLPAAVGSVKVTSGKFFGFLRHSFQDIGSGTKY